MSEALDVSDTIVAKSDQLNADDLIGGPLVGRIVRVFRCGVSQGMFPVQVHHALFHRVCYHHSIHWWVSYY